jgi:hypothetical protein
MSIPSGEQAIVRRFENLINDGKVRRPGFFIRNQIFSLAVDARNFEGGFESHVAQSRCSLDVITHVEVGD